MPYYYNAEVGAPSSFVTCYDQVPVPHLPDAADYLPMTLPPMKSKGTTVDLRLPAPEPDANDLDDLPMLWLDLNGAFWEYAYGD